VRIYPIRLSAHPGRVAYVIHMPESRRAPHQAHDKRHYKRQNFESAPIEEYEIRDVTRRQDMPELAVVFHLADLPDSAASNQRVGAGKQTCSLRVVAKNVFDAIVTHAAFHLYVEHTIELNGDYSPFTKVSDTSFDFAGVQRFCSVYLFKLCPPASFPIFRGLSYAPFNTPVTLTVSSEVQGLLFAEGVCPGMPKRPFSH